MDEQRPQPQRKADSALRKLRSWVARWPTAHGNELGRPPNSARLRAAPSPRSAAIQIRPIIPPDRRAKNPPKRIALAVLAFAALAAPPLRAAEATELFTAARTAFQRNDYEQALALFEAAADAGMSGPAVQFNIGVAAYRAGRRERAETAFLEAARTPAMAALAHYNLGLVALSRGRRTAAARWFMRAQTETSDERVRSLADAQLAILSPDPQRNWAGYASVGWGYDDNVALASDANLLEVSGAGDYFTEAQLAVSGPLAQPWRFDASAFIVDYEDLSAFDQINAQGGARYKLRAGSWTQEAFVQLTYAALDGEGYESKRTLGLQASRELTPAWRMRARYRYNDIAGLNAFPGVTGSRSDVEARFIGLHDDWELGVGYRFESGNLQDEALSLSRHEVLFGLRRDWRAIWSLALDIALQQSRYEAQSGNENEYAFACTIARRLTPRWRLVLRYAYADHEAGVAAFDYQHSRVTAALEAVL